MYIFNILSVVYNHHNHQEDYASLQETTREKKEILITWINFTPKTTINVLYLMTPSQCQTCQILS